MCSHLYMYICIHTYIHIVGCAAGAFAGPRGVCPKSLTSGGRKRTWRASTDGTRRGLSHILASKTGCFDHIRPRTEDRSTPFDVSCLHREESVEERESNAGLPSPENANMVGHRGVRGCSQD